MIVFELGLMVVNKTRDREKEFNKISWKDNSDKGNL